MTFHLDHWKNPRQTIAAKFKDNDIAYATHGAVLAMEALRYINKTPAELKSLKLLDYGCGTGRVTRVLSGLFGEVHGYDPVEECITLAKTECTGIHFHNIHYTSAIENVPKADMAICINVIEHLNDMDAQALVTNLKNKVNGPTYLWYSIAKNKNFMTKYLTKEQILEDSTKTGINIREFYFA